MSRVGKPYGQAKSPGNYNDSNSSSMSSPGVYIGIVKKNDDPQHMGRLQVWIEAFGGDPENKNTWISVMYASPFAGSTSIFDQGTNVKEYEDTIKSYGWWAIPPDIDARVLVAFADGGKLDKGYWFACLYQRGTQISVPGIPAKKTWTGDPKPAAPKNRKDLDPDLEKYVEHKPLSNALKKQGLEADNLRGITSSSAMRETPSKVMGLLTPGQHQFVLDDGDKDGNNRLIRLRTTNGTQLLLDDVAGHIYLISKNGENWIEMSSDGKIHLYGSSDINIRSQGNINMYSDLSVNIEAGQSVNVKTNGGSIKLESANELSTFATSNTKITSLETSNINSGVGHYETAGVIHMNGPIADVHQPIELYQLTVNQGVTESICSIVPEHEPWAGHSGIINSVGHGNQQMQQDPAPGQQARLPRTGETPAPIIREELPADQRADYKKLDEVATSEQAQTKIKEQNGFSPVNVKDGDGQSGGWGSKILTPANIGKAVSTGGKLLGRLTGIPQLGVAAGTIGKGVEQILRDRANPGNLISGGGISGQGISNTLAAPKTMEDLLENIAIREDFAKYGNNFTSPNLNPLAPENQLKTRGLQLPSGSEQSGQYLSEQAFNEFKRATDASDSLLGQPASPPTQLNPGPNLTKEQIQEVLGKGISPATANQMFANDISNNETEVKKVLENSGVTRIPQGVFDGLVSMQNQLGDISYAYIGGEKIDLTPFYKAEDWPTLASFVAADERDRPRRIQEAAMIAKNNYGPFVNEQNLIDSGMTQAAELLAKGKLNKQTGEAATDQQTVALATNYFSSRQESLPSISSPLKLEAAKNLAEETFTRKSKKLAGPWPY